MSAPVIEDKAQLTDLASSGQPAAPLVTIGATHDRETRRRLMEAISHYGAAQIADGASAARSQDFLHDGGGLPV